MSSISSVIRMGFIVLVLFIAGQAGVMFWAMSQNNNLLEGSINKDFGSSLLISRMAIEGNKLRRYEKEFFIYVGNDEKLTKYEGEWNDSYRKLEQMLQQAIDNESNAWSMDELHEVHLWHQSLKDYGNGFRRVVVQVRAGVITDTISANNAISEAKNRFRVLLDGTATGGDKRYEHASNATVQIKKRNHLLAFLLLGSSAIGFLIALVLAFKIPSSISSSIDVLSDAAESMSKGQLDKSVPVDSAKDEFRTLAETLERMRISQKTLIDRIRSRAKNQ